MEEKGKKQGQKGKSGGLEGGGGGGGRRNAGGPRDMPLMPPFCDTILVSNVFMLKDSRCCGQYPALSISCSYNSGKDFKR